MILPILCIAPSGKKGRGVFTSKDLSIHTVVEISPVIVLSASERSIVEKTRLFDYIFEWGKSRKQCCIALGYLSLYNHHVPANCMYEMDYENKTMQITTVMAIKKGDELFVNYHADPGNDAPIWFETV